MAEQEADDHDRRQAGVPHQVIPDIDGDTLVPVRPGKQQDADEYQQPDDGANDLHCYSPLSPIMPRKPKAFGQGV